MILFALVLSSPFAKSQPHDGVAVFAGPSGGAGDVLVLDEHGRESRPSALQGIVLMPFELEGRTRLDELRPERPRLVGDVPGATRARLPGESGCLYRYRRDEPGGAVFGFFVVPPDGRAESVLELRGTGLLGADDPVATRVAVGPRGETILLGTSLAAGGDLLEVDLDDRRATNRTARFPPLGFRASGVRLHSSWGVALTDAGPLRFKTDAGAQAKLVAAEAGWPGWIGSELVSSADESTVAFVAGRAPTRACVYVLGRDGAARRVTAREAPLSGAGFLPEVSAGPTLALSSDGSHVAWRTEGVEREAFVGRTDTAGTWPELQITGDADFEDTLNDTGVIAFFGRDELTLFVGEGAPAGTIVDGDLFRVRVEPAGTLAITDLSRTNERAAAPFGYGRIELANGLVRVPGAPRWLVRDPGLHPGEGQLLWVDERADAPLALLSRAGAPEKVQAYEGVLFALVPSVSSAVPRRFLRLELDSLALCTWALGAETELARFAADDDGLAVVLARPDGERLGRTGDGCDAGELLSSEPYEFGPTLSLVDDVLYATTRVRGAWNVLAWSPSGATMLLSGLSAGFVLPGD